MSRKQSRLRATKKRKGTGTRRRLPRVGSIVAGGLVAAVVGFIAVIVVYGAMGGKGGVSDFVPSIVETGSESAAEPVEGGARLYFPIESIDMGHVPLNTEVGYAFAMTNLGDAPAHIEDIDISMVEGC